MGDQGTDGVNCAALDRCLACGGTSLRAFFDACMQPLANSFHAPGEGLQRYPLGLKVCRDCWHSQLTYAVDPHLMFDDYPYVSGTSATLREYMREFAEKVSSSWTTSGKVLEIGCNDGTLLNWFTRSGCFTVGIDPASNVIGKLDFAHEMICGFWNSANAELVVDLAGDQFDIIIAMNVLAHVADPLTFLQLCKRVLAPGGRIYVQTSQAKMIERGEFDTVYHEHHSFFTVSSMLALAARAELRVDAISHVPVHGTSYLFELVDGECVAQDWNEFAIGRVEHDKGYYAIGIYEEFSLRADYLRREAKNLIAVARLDGYRIVGYGAAAKAMTFLNFCGLQLDCIIDDAPLKIGKFTPGMNIPVVSIYNDWTKTEKILFVILAWNFRDEIMARIKATRDSRDDKFLTFFPTVSLV